MKRFGLVLSASILLVACGEEAATEPVEIEETLEDTEVEPEEAEVDQNTEFTVEPEEPVGTQDPVEFADKTNEVDLYVNGEHQMKIVNRYSNEETDENGFNHVSFKGYDYKFAVLGVEDNYGEEMIILAGETENGTGDPVAFNSDVEIITSNQEQVQSYTAVGESEPNVKQKAFIPVDLEFGLPESLTMTMQPPLKEIEADVSYEEGHYGEPIELKFTKE